MSAAATASVPTTKPDPQDRPAAGAPDRVLRLLTLVRWLIAYGKEVASALQQRAAAPNFASVAKTVFCTSDIALILERITRGLHRAAALEARLARCAATGRDPAPSPDKRAPSPRKPPVPAEADPSDAAPSEAAKRATRTKDPNLVRLPTLQEIAAQVRRRPVGAVIADICRDLGIAPGMLDRAQWNALAEAIVAYGGNLARYLKDVLSRFELIPRQPAIAPAQAAPVPSPRSPDAACTGPP